MIKLLVSTVLILSSLVAIGCVDRRPLGPAERLGRTIDQLGTDLTEISAEYDKRAAEQKAKDQEAKIRQLELERMELEQELARERSRSRGVDSKSGSYDDRSSYRSPNDPYERRNPSREYDRQY